jgi:hypothetical protein
MGERRGARDSCRAWRVLPHGFGLARVVVNGASVLPSISYVRAMSGHPVEAGGGSREMVVVEAV